MSDWRIAGSYIDERGDPRDRSHDEPPPERPDRCEYDEPDWRPDPVPCECADPGREILSGRYCALCGNVVPGR